jgi:hypothetical protein
LRVGGHLRRRCSCHGCMLPRRPDYMRNRNLPNSTQ